MSVAENWKKVAREIESLAGGRNVQVIAVSKRQPLDKVQEAIAAGAREFGENRIQEAWEKFPNIDTKDVVVHHIGPLQSGNLRKLFGLIRYTHGVGSTKALRDLLARSEKEKTKIGYFLQLNLTGEDSKSGMSEEDCNLILKDLEVWENQYCKLEGFMTMGPSDGNPERTREVFRHLREFRDKFYPQGKLSMGMSGDYKIAIEEGSDLVRIGSAIFGERNYE